VTAPTCETRIGQTANCESAGARASLLAAVCVADRGVLGWRLGPRAGILGTVEWSGACEVEVARVEMVILGMRFGVWVLVGKMGVFEVGL
jgi:hypothetical protein